MDGAGLIALVLILFCYSISLPASAQTTLSEGTVHQTNRGMLFGKIEPGVALTPELRGEMTVAMPKPSYSDLEPSSNSPVPKRPSVCDTAKRSLFPKSPSLTQTENSAAIESANIESATNEERIVDKAVTHQKKDSHSASQVRLANKPKISGTADYYADKFHGRKTASGQIHDKTKFTAAHRTLPFGTKLKIVNRTNGKSVVVVVNDRGPFTKSRLIDLSYAAAKEIELISSKTRLVDCFLVEE